MNNLNLMPNEAVILKNDSVSRYEGKSFGNSGELVLTNMNLFFIVQKGFFGNKQEVQKFPLNQVKVIDGKAQLRVSNDNNLEIYFMNGQQSFSFSSFGKRDSVKWANAVSKALTGHEADLTDDEKSYIAGVGAVADTLKNTFGSFKKGLGINEKEPERATTRCMSCRAPLAGIKGQIVKCKYCDTEQTI